MRHRNKHQTVFLCSLRLEKIITNRIYVLSLDIPNTAWDIVTQYIINDKEIIIGIQLNNIV